jgi:hypothetical protein
MTSNTQTIKVSATINSPFSGLVDRIVYDGGAILDPMASPFSFYYTATATALENNGNIGYSGKSKSIFDREINPQSLFFGNNGNIMYMLGNVSDKVHVYNLSPAWVIESATYSTFLNLNPSLESSPTGLFFKSDGAKMYVIGDQQNKVLQYNLSTPWNVNTATYVSEFPVLFEQGSKGLYISPDGLNLYVTGISSKKIHQYGLTTPWEISTGTYPLKEFSVQNQESQPSDLFFKPDGTELFIIGLEKAKVFEYKLLTPWDITTSINTNYFFTLTSQDNRPVGINFKNDGLKFYILGSQQDSVFQYNIPSTQAWNVSSSDIKMVVLSGGTFKINYNDLKNIKQTNKGNYVFCDTEVDFNFSQFDETKSKIIKLVFDPNNGEKIQTFSAQVSNNNFVVYPNLSSIKTKYYPSELYNTFYYPNFKINYEDGNFINLTVPLTVFQCGIYEKYKEKRILETVPYYANTQNVLIFINDDRDNELFIGDINTRLPFILSANVPSKDVELPFLLELVPQQSTVESIDPFIPEPPINENPIYLNSGHYIYAEYRGISINPNFVKLSKDDYFENNINLGLTISEGGAPYFAGTGITIEVIQLD